MIKYVSKCVECPPERGCLRSACPYFSVPVRVCDFCGIEADAEDLTGVGTLELCPGCYHRAARIGSLHKRSRDSEKGGKARARPGKYEGYVPVSLKAVHSQKLPKDSGRIFPT